MSWNPYLEKIINNFDGCILAGPRTGSKTSSMQISMRQPSFFKDLRVARVSSLQPNISLSLEKGGNIIKWFEMLAGSPVMERTQNGEPLLVGSERRFYLGAWLNQEANIRIFQKLAEKMEITTEILPEGLRVREMVEKKLVMNYNAFSVTYRDHPIPATGYIFL